MKSFLFEDQLSINVSIIKQVIENLHICLQIPEFSILKETISMQSFKNQLIVFR